MPSELEAALARHRRALRRDERAAQEAMARAWAASWQHVRADALALHARMATTEPTLNDVLRDQRLASLQSQIEAELRRLAPLAAQEATNLQRDALAAATANADEAMRLAGVTGTFERVNVGAVEAMVGLASDGSPLAALFEGIGPDVAPRLTGTLAQGIALGLSPRVTARMMQRTYGVGLTRALTIARTETLRAYRSATHDRYQANARFLDGWVWVCACTARSCAACWAMHGSVHPLSERLDGHPNCRCAMAPLAKGVPSRIVPAGAERFAALPEADQMAVLGPGLFAAWQDGRAVLTPTGRRSVVVQRRDPRWGTMRVPRPLYTFP